MSPVTSCPSPEQLRLLAQGRLPFGQVEELAEHLEECDDCARTMQTLPGDDTLAELIRRQARTRDKSPDATLQGLMERLRGLCTSAPQATRNLDPEDFDFLAPARGPNELGWLAHYRVLQVLGSGGMGVVFRAEDTQLQRIVALKAMKPGWGAGASAKPRFLREARAAAALKHDHIVTIYQVGEDRGVPFLAMEFLEGTSLEDPLQTGRPVSLAAILRIGREVADGLAAAHARGLVHRDIKPANVWLEQTHGLPSVGFSRTKILDFGLALGIEEPARLTQPGAIVGTPGYLAPEQVNGTPTDARTDLFSLGCVLYRLCTGRLPFSGATTLATLAALTLEEPKAVRSLNSSIPEPLAELVMRLLAKRPEDRPQSAREVVAVIEAVEQGTTGEPGYRRSGSRRATLIALALFLLGGPLAAWQIFIRIKDRNGKVEITLPAGSSLELRKDGKPFLSIGPNDRRGQPSKVQYLSDLPEFDVKVSEARFAKSGNLGYMAGDSRRIQVKAEESPHGLSMHALPNTFAGVKYRLDKTARTFRASAALNDSAGGAGRPPGQGRIPTPVTFQVVGDGKVLWKSGPVDIARDVRECEVDVSGVDVLELRVDCPGTNTNGQCVWLEPRVLLK